MAERDKLPPRAEQALDRLKYEVAEDVGVDLREGGDLTTREAGQVGGQMVRRLVRRGERALARQRQDEKP
jgi:hypothetical protein